MKAFIYTGGEIFPENITEKAKAGDIKIAADGGYKNALRLGVKVDILLGDFDSIGEHKTDEDVEIIKVPAEKDFTDTQLAVRIALDVAASEWQSAEGRYRLPKRGLELSREELVEHLCHLCDSYPIYSIEDGLGEDDTEGWQLLTARLGKRVMLVGDDLFVTNTKRLANGIEKGIANAILIKPNQIGTVSETLSVIELAGHAGYRTVLSHRSGETEDTTIADLAVGTNTPFIKSGAPCRSERVAKYNRLLRIESSIGYTDAPQAIHAFKQPKTHTV